MDSEARSCIIEAMPPRDAAETLLEITRGGGPADAALVQDVQAAQVAALASMSAPAASNILQHMSFRVGRAPRRPGHLGYLPVPQCAAAATD
jgi:hypothetical protein